MKKDAVWPLQQSIRQIGVRYASGTRPLAYSLLMQERDHAVVC